MWSVPDVSLDHSDEEYVPNYCPKLWPETKFRSKFMYSGTPLGHTFILILMSEIKLVTGGQVRFIRLIVILQYSRYRLKSLTVGVFLD